MGVQPACAVQKSQVLKLFFLVILMASCPVCDAEVEFATDTVVGELMSCGDCGCELEVLALEPAKLGEAPETEEDWGE